MNTTHARLRVAALGALVIALPLAAGAQGGFGGFGAPQEEIKLLERFDQNGDKMLDAAERKAARATVAGRTGGGRFGRGGFGPGGSTETPRPGRRLTPAGVQAYPASTSLYDLGTIRTIFLEFESADWERELEDFHNTDVDVPVTMTVDGQTYRHVGVRFRGASSYMFVAAGLKRPLNVSIDYVHEGQHVGSYRTLNLLNANTDPSFLRAVLYTEIARQYLPTPRMNFVRVVINGESWGLYLNAQQFNRDFARDYFERADGVRWKVPGSPWGMGGLEYLGESPDAYRSIYEIKNRDNQKSWADLIRLTRVLNETPPEKLEAALAPLFNIDGALRFLAVEMALVNSDGYWTRASDYNIFQDAKGVFHIIPHDVNEALGVGGGGFGGGGGPTLDPLAGLNDSSKPLRSKLLAVPALRARYLAYVRDIAERHLDWNTLGPQVERLHALIAADVKADTKKLNSYSQFEGGPASIRAFTDRRRAFLLR